MNSLSKLLREVRRCDLCAASLPNAPRPVLTTHREARLLIIGQAPGRRVHESGVPWADASGDRLREWMGVDREEFYGSECMALMPMGLCFPGTGTSGDLPPRPECAGTWHEKVLAAMPKVQLTLLLSQYALKHYLGTERRSTLTETVRAWRDFLPGRIPLPHPSPRNNRWLKKNPWFEQSVLPELRKRVRAALS